MSCSGEGYLSLPVYRVMVDSTCAYVNATCQSTSVSWQEKVPVEWKRRKSNLTAPIERFLGCWQPYARQIAGRLMGRENAKNPLKLQERILTVLQHSREFRVLPW
ncbi:hypothetical protein CEXT_520401 [Caerostris extrusa]|uniref:Uncharacterized protein n=1 Tax=Caerostris extrusa TaxID=172846 RepID=A0AAV4PSC3_CAEEX|nr:hypothetical protein CEXT_520401 [Caerostris extrusa]